MRSSFSIGSCGFYVDELAPVRLRVWYSHTDRAWHVSVRRETWDAPVNFKFEQTRRAAWALTCESEQTDERGRPIRFENLVARV